MANFKLGDKVRAKHNAPYGITTNGWVGEVVKICNDKNMIVHGKGACGKKKDGCGFTVAPKYFEKVCDNKIVITTDGVTTTAKLYDGKTVVKTATAKCAPDDEFNFETGAKIAFERLTGTENTEWKPKVGERVIITANTTRHNFDIGAEVVVESLFDDSARCRDESDYWYVKFTDMKPTTLETPTAPTNVFDWDKFKAGELFVLCTKDNYDNFIAEAKKHGCEFHDGDTPDPFKNITAFILRHMISNPLADDEVIINVEHGELKFSVTNLENCEIFKW